MKKQGTKRGFRSLTQAEVIYVKKWLVLVTAVVMLLIACGSLAEPAETEEPFMWSWPGKYLTDALEPRADIRDAKEADAYAEEIWALISDDPLPEGEREMNIDEHDQSYHFDIHDAEGIALYNANFLSNGVIQQIGYTDVDLARAVEQGVRRSGDELEADRWEPARKQLEEQAETIAPGIMELVETPEVYAMIDAGDKLYLMIYAAPKDPEYESGLNLTGILYEDGTCKLMDFSCYGAG